MEENMEGTNIRGHGGVYQMELDRPGKGFQGIQGSKIIFSHQGVTWMNSKIVTAHWTVEPITKRLHMSASFPLLPSALRGRSGAPPEASGAPESSMHFESSTSGMTSGEATVQDVLNEILWAVAQGVQDSSARDLQISGSFGANAGAGLSNHQGEIKGGGEAAVAGLGDDINKNVAVLVALTLIFSIDAEFGMGRLVLQGGAEAVVTCKRESTLGDAGGGQTTSETDAQELSTSANRFDKPLIGASDHLFHDMSAVQYKGGDRVAGLEVTAEVTGRDKMSGAAGNTSSLRFEGDWVVRCEGRELSRHLTEEDAKWARLEREIKRLRGGKTSQAHTLVQSIISGIIAAVLGQDAQQPATNLSEAILEVSSQDLDWEQRMLGALTLGSLPEARGHADAIQALCDAVAGDASWSVRGTAASSLAELAPRGHSGAVAALSLLVLGKAQEDSDACKAPGWAEGVADHAEDGSARQAGGGQKLLKESNIEGRVGAQKEVTASEARGQGALALAKMVEGSCTDLISNVFLPPIEGNGNAADPFLLLALVQSLEKLVSSQAWQRNQGGDAEGAVTAANSLLSIASGSLSWIRAHGKVVREATCAREAAYSQLQSKLNRFTGSPTKFNKTGGGGWESRMAARTHAGTSAGTSAGGLGEIELARKQYEETRRREQKETERLADVEMRSNVAVAALGALNVCIQCAAVGDDMFKACVEAGVDAARDVENLSPVVRASGVALIGSCGRQSFGGREVVLSCLKDASLVVREAAARAVGSLCALGADQMDSEAEKALVECIQCQEGCNGGDVVLSHAYESLGTVGSGNGVGLEAAFKGLLYGEERVVLSATRALCKMSMKEQGVKGGALEVALKLLRGQGDAGLKASIAGLVAIYKGGMSDKSLKRGLTSDGFADNLDLYSKKSLLEGAGDSDSAQYEVERPMNELPHPLAEGEVASHQQQARAKHEAPVHEEEEEGLVIEGPEVGKVMNRLVGELGVCARFVNSERRARMRGAIVTALVALGGGKQAGEFLGQAAVGDLSAKLRAEAVLALADLHKRGGEDSRQGARQGGARILEGLVSDMEKIGSKRVAASVDLITDAVEAKREKQILKSAESVAGTSRNENHLHPAKVQEKGLYQHRSAPCSVIRGLDANHTLRSRSKLLASDTVRAEGSPTLEARNQEGSSRFQGEEGEQVWKGAGKGKTRREGEYWTDILEDRKSNGIYKMLLAPLDSVASLGKSGVLPWSNVYQEDGIAFGSHNFLQSIKGVDVENLETELQAAIHKVEVLSIRVQKVTLLKRRQGKGPKDKERLSTELKESKSKAAALQARIDKGDDDAQLRRRKLATEKRIIIINQRLEAVQKALDESKVSDAELEAVKQSLLDADQGLQQLLRQQEFVRERVRSVCGRLQGQVVHDLGSHEQHHVQGRILLGMDDEQADDGNKEDFGSLTPLNIPNNTQEGVECVCCTFGCSPGPQFAHSIWGDIDDLVQKTRSRFKFLNQGIVNFGGRSDEFIKAVAAEPILGNEKLKNAKQLEGCVAVMTVGGCSCVAKALRAQQAGAVGVILLSKAEGGDLVPPSSGPGEFQVTIPVFCARARDMDRICSVSVIRVMIAMGSEGGDDEDEDDGDCTTSMNLSLNMAASDGAQRTQSSPIRTSASPSKIETVLLKAARKSGILQRDEGLLCTPVVETEQRRDVRDKFAKWLEKRDRLVTNQALLPAIT